MDEKKIQQIQDDILSGIDKELDLDRQIDSDAEEISYNLSKSNKTKFRVASRDYLFQSGTYTNKQGKKCIVIYATDIDLASRAKAGDYTPYVINSEISNDFPYKDNLKATVEVFIRQKLGALKPGELPEPDSGIIL